MIDMLKEKTKWNNIKCSIKRKQKKKGEKKQKTNAMNRKQLQTQ